MATDGALARDVWSAAWTLLSVIATPQSSMEVPQPAQQESCVTSLVKVWAASFKPSTIVR